MPALATTDPQPAPAAPVPTKRVRIPPKVRHACELLAKGNVKTVSAAAERVKLSREHLSRTLQLPHIQAFIAHESRRTIATATMRASNRLVELIDAQSEHVAAKVSERILTSEGILKSDQASIAVNVDVRAGFVIDLSDPAAHGSYARDIAKPLINQETVSDDGGKGGG